MYTKDKGNRVTVRLNDKQMEYVNTVSKTLKTTPSEFLRMLLNLYISKSVSNEHS